MAIALFYNTLYSQQVCVQGVRIESDHGVVTTMGYRITYPTKYVYL